MPKTPRGRRLSAMGSLVAVAASALVALSPAASTGAAPAVRDACSTAAAGSVRCLAQYVETRPDGTLDLARASRAVTPADIQAAYRLPVNRGAGRTVAIVDAYDNPKAEADLAVFRAKYGLPACTTDNGCFRKVNQEGDVAPLPQRDRGWGLEIALDLDAVSAACPRCTILLVEATSASFSDIGTAVNTAVALGADVVSNSYGADEFRGVRALGARYYEHPGVPIVASSGDFGFTAASFPAVLGTTIAAGGTTLLRAAGSPRGWRESVWAGAGSGCSAYIPKPAWQHDPNCLMRTVADVSAVADPETGLIVVDTFGFPGEVQVGGTSLSAPLVAAMYAMSADPSAVDDPSALYSATGGINDVVGGRNGYCGGDYLCTGLPGYDAPSGVGTPRGVSALS